jgi:hypothetical protein
MICTSSERILIRLHRISWRYMAPRFQLIPRMKSHLTFISNERRRKVQSLSTHLDQVSLLLMVPSMSKSKFQRSSRMDAKYLDKSLASDSAYRLESYRSFGTVSSVHSTTLRCYFIHKCNFVIPSPTKEQSEDINLVSDKYFLEKAAPNTVQVYQNIMKKALVTTGPVIEIFEVTDSREKRLVIAFKQNTTQSFFSAMSDLYHFYDLYTTRKYVGLSLAFNPRAILQWNYHLLLLFESNAKQ